MGMGGMIDILFFGSGIYLIYTASMAKKHGTIAANVMLSKDVGEKDIIDKTGFIGYMYKRILLAGVMIIIASGIHLVNDYYIQSKAVTWAGIGIILVAIGIYSAAYMRGQKLYMKKHNKSSGKKR